MQLPEKYKEHFDDSSALRPFVGKLVICGYKVTYSPEGSIALRPIYTQEIFPQQENFVKCDWPTQIFRRKKILKLKIFS